jgi:hypothetical protein
MDDFLSGFPVNRQILVVALSIASGWILRFVSQSIIARVAQRAGFLDGDIIARNAGTAIIWIPKQFNR